MAKTADLLPGTLDMLILKAVSLTPLHGYGVLLRIEQISRRALEIPQGSLYPALVPAGAPGSHRGRVGRERQQQEGEVLHRDGRGRRSGSRRRPRDGTGWPLRSARR